MYIFLRFGLIFKQNCSMYTNSLTFSVSWVGKFIIGASGSDEQLGRDTAFSTIVHMRYFLNEDSDHPEQPSHRAHS